MPKVKKHNCAKCGACSTVCPVYQISGRESLTARGKIHLLSKLDGENASDLYADILAKCLLCGACADVCPRQIMLPGLIAEEREKLSGPGGQFTFLQYIFKKLVARPKLCTFFIDIIKSLVNKLPAESGLRLKLYALPQSPDNTHTSPPDTTKHENRTKAADIAGNFHIKDKNLPETANNVSPAVYYFTGCLAGIVQKEIATATKTLLAVTHNGSAVIPSAQACCGLAHMNSGDLKIARRLAKNNITAFADHSRPILTSCASCYTHLKSYPELLADNQEWQAKAFDFATRVCEFSIFFSVKFQGKSLEKLTLKQPKIKKSVYYHDPCHLRFKAKVTKEPRQILATLTDIELVELRQLSQCCGFGGLFHLSQQSLSQAIFDNLLSGFKGIYPDIVTTTCSGCLLQWQQQISAQKLPIETRHLAVLLLGACRRMDFSPNSVLF